MIGPIWKKSKRCEAGHCVEIRLVDGMIEMRNPTSPNTSITITPNNWEEFTKGIKDGEFDNF